MADSNQHDQDNLEYLRNRLTALDRDIPVPETAKAQALLRRAQSAPTLRAVQGGMWKRVTGLAAALVIVVSGAVYLLPQMGQMPAEQAQSWAAQPMVADAQDMDESEQTQSVAEEPMMAAVPGTEESAAAYDETIQVAPRMAAPDPRVQEMEAFYAKDYAEVRLRLKEVQSVPTIREKRPATGDDGTVATHPDSGGQESGASGALTGGGAGEIYTTNVQTKGVDEADIVKTDGEYLYYLCTPPAQGEEPTEPMVKILNSDTLAVTSTIQFAGDDYPTELFLFDDVLAVLTQSTIAEIPFYQTYDTGVEQSGKRTVQSTGIDIYDISNPENPVSQRRFEQQGDYTSSRMVEDIIYLVTNSSVPANAHISEVTDEQLMPAVLNTALSATPTTLAAENICLPAAVTSDAYTVVSAVSLSEPTNTTTKAVLGGGNTVYMSRGNLYIAGQEYHKELASYSTKLIKFGAVGTDLILLAQSSVPGRIDGQFALNESAQGNLCVATTTQQYADPAAAREVQQAKDARVEAKRAGNPVKVDDALREQEQEATRITNSSGVYVLDNFLDPLGQVEGLAPEETIYSVRYIGNMAYLVTFKQVDPLFAVDLSNPAAPKVLGQLKVPGFSEYLHPIGNDTLLGLGYETRTNRDDMITTLGLKLSLFDVSNPAQPTETQTYRMGDAGSYSQALGSHKAFLYYAQKNLVGLPVSLYTEVGEPSADPWARNYKFAFDGMYLFKVTPEKITYYGAVTHSAGLDENSLYHAGLGVERGMFVDDALYLFSNAMVTSYSLTTLEQTAQVRL